MSSEFFPEGDCSGIFVVLSNLLSNLLDFPDLDWEKQDGYPSFLFLGNLCVTVVDEDGNLTRAAKDMADAYSEVVAHAAEKDFTSKHWEPLTACGDQIVSYKHSKSGDRVVVQLVNWPLPKGKETKGIILCASDHKGYEKFLRGMTASYGKDKAKAKKRKRKGN